MGKSPAPAGCDLLLVQIEQAGLPTPEREYRFCPPRRWRMDYAWPDRLIFMEREGGIWTGGRHTRPVGFMRDIDKYNEAALLGYRLIRFTPEMEQDGRALELARRLLGTEGRG